MSSIDNTQAPVGLIIPIDVSALCVGTIDEQEATNSFAGATTVYISQVTSKTEAFIGSNVTRNFSDAPWQQLEQGIHLHWALPDALTSADASSDTLIFPAAPNRWLVTRIVNQGTAVITRSWIVESDTLLEDLPQGQKSITLPVKTTSQHDQNYRYIGRWLEFSTGWKEPGSSAAEKMKDLTGTELNAVSSGDIAFAAFYPNCRSSFGFYDSLTDVSVPAGSCVNIMYCINGWFGTPENDPLYNGATLADTQEKFKWTFDSSDSELSYSVYNGTVQSISWSPQTEYIYQQSSTQPIKAEAALGNNPAEVLSAYFRNKNYPDIPFFEQLLNAFQSGLLSSFKQPQPGQLTELAEALHQKEFSNTNSGCIYSIVKKGDTGDDPEEVDDIPDALADALNQLNICRQKFDYYTDKLNNFRWQLFADWYRIFEASPDIQNVAYMTAYHRYAKWSSLQDIMNKVNDELSKQLKAVEDMLDDSIELKTLSAPRYWQPSEPVVLLAGDDLVPPARYGGDGRHTSEGNLVCRIATQVLTAISLGGKSIGAGQYGNTALQKPNGLAYPDIFNSLILEACLLNTALISACTEIDIDVLNNAIQKALSGESQDVYTFTGNLPSPVGMNWWAKNPWLPLFIEWNVQFHPLQVTSSGNQLNNYTEGFFTSNYTIDPDSGGFVSYSPGTAPDSIHVDPANIDYPQEYKGSAILSPSAAYGFEEMLSDYLKDHEDSSLQKILEQLKSTNIMMQALSGFNNCLNMRRQSLQLNVQVPSGSNYYDLTQAIAPVVGDMNNVAPDFNGYFNPVRAGYLKLSVRVIDAYGQRRDVNVSQLICAQSMTAYSGEKQVASTVYIPPRISQPSRLLLRWISADSLELDEMNEHPATSPICGWLLPDHLDGSFFLYNKKGKPLGTLCLNGNGTKIEWQSAPGDNTTINQSVQEVMQYENPHLRDLAVSLKNGSPSFFKAFWRAIDTANTLINPQNSSSDIGISVIIGHPVALVQTSIRLEVQGSPAINQGWQCFSPSEYNETENGFTNIKFPVVLGDLKRLDDGLVGYFKQNADGSYNLGTFFTKSADPASKSGIVQPDAATITLSPSPKLNDDNPSVLDRYTQKLLMLVDPRASIHATMGILPTKKIEIPPSQYVDDLNTLEFTLPATPVLKAANGLAIPVPSESGYQLSWVEEDKSNTGAAQWSVIPDILSATEKAVWAYTPQQITEGWLRLNPVLLEFSLVNASGKPVVIKGQSNSITLNIKNLKGRSITFNPGQSVPEGETNSGSVFYIHFESLVNQGDVSNIKISAPGWVFQCINDEKYGSYWVATPAQGSPVNLASGGIIKIAVENVMVSADNSEVQVYFDYYGINGLSDGVYQCTLTVQGE